MKMFAKVLIIFFCIEFVQMDKDCSTIWKYFQGEDGETQGEITLPFEPVNEHKLKVVLSVAGAVGPVSLTKKKLFTS
jgi:hypothetical protein